MAHSLSIDSFDIALLRIIQRDATLTNAQLSEVLHLSPSQCSRRRAALEAAGIITGYAAQLNADALGFGFRAITRINLSAHRAEIADQFRRFIAAQPEVRSVYSVSGDCDYVLEVRTQTLSDFAAFIHDRLLPAPGVGQVRSDIVLQTLKDSPAEPLELL